MTHAPYSQRWLTQAELAEMAQQLRAVNEPLPELLLRTGVMSGPFRRTRPVTLGPWRRLVRAVRSIITINQRSKT